MVISRSLTLAGNRRGSASAGTSNEGKYDALQTPIGTIIRYNLREI
ncbi:MAG: hypothetical protein GDA56_01980 [Hormoscilla sp. GM7CHS1pb]|nr:hypothetical protein [Hormoscilla sp. GM7CHS1pb]